MQPSLFSRRQSRNNLADDQRETREKLICMLNLCGDESENWADGRNDVLDPENVVLSVQFFGTIKKIISASPDFEYGNCKGCEYTVLYKKQGPRVDIKIDKIHRFTFVLIETEE